MDEEDESIGGVRPPAYLADCISGNNRFIIFFRILFSDYNSVTWAINSK